jgi:hypothetical protein
MNNKLKLFGIATFVAVVAVVALGTGAAFAQTSRLNIGLGPGWMMGGRGAMMSGYAQNGNSWGWMNTMHQWMTSNGGGMHTFVWNTVAEKLGLTSDELNAEINSGKTLAQVAEEKGISRSNLVAVLETAHKDSLSQAVTDGTLTQEQADNILAQMSGNYEWMLDNMGRGGMMGGQYGQGGMMNGQYGQGGCHRNLNGAKTDQQPRP